MNALELKLKCKIEYISKKTTLRPGASGAPCASDVPGAYNINSSSGCYRPGCCPLGAHIKRQGASGAVRCTLSSNHAPSETCLFPAAPDTTGSSTTSPRGLPTMNYLHPVTPSAIPWRLNIFRRWYYTLPYASQFTHTRPSSQIHAPVHPYMLQFTHSSPTCSFTPHNAHSGL